MRGLLTGLLEPAFETLHRRNCHEMWIVCSVVFQLTLTINQSNGKIGCSYKSDYIALMLQAVVASDAHVLRQFFPPVAKRTYNLCPRNHPLLLSDRYFVSRVLSEWEYIYLYMISLQIMCIKKHSYYRNLILHYY